MAHAGGVEQREVQDKTYYQFEFTAKAGQFTRHQLATVGISNGTLCFALTPSAFLTHRSIRPGF